MSVYMFYTNSFASTTTKVLINDWQAARAIIAESTSTLRNRQQTDVSSPENQMSLISDQQFYDATSGPLHPFINKLLWAYSYITKIRLKIIITQDDSFNQYILDKNVELPEHINIKEINIASLDKIIRQLDFLATQHYQQWQALMKEFSERLIMQLTMNNVNLSDIEIKMLSNHEPLSEILAQFTDLRLDLPKTKDNLYHFSDYFRLKAILCLHSSLSRQHKPHVMEDIQKLLKPLKNNFKHIHDEENQLIVQHHQAVDNLLSKVKT